MISAVPLVAMRGAKKTFLGPAGEIPVLRSVDVEIGRGEFVVITGPSGAGKSTLLNVVGLLEPLTAGEYCFDGRTVSAAGDTERSRLRAGRMGFVFQRFCLMPDRTVLDNVCFRGRYAGGVEPSRARALLEEVGLGALAERRARWLSAGEMQRVALARAVVIEPAILLADEPTGNLDVANAQQIMHILGRLHARGITVLLVTHNPEWLRYATRHLICRDGALAAA